MNRADKKFGHKVTVDIWTEINFSPLIMHPQESQGCQKMSLYPLNSNLEVWYYNMELNWTNFKKLSKLKKSMFFMFFQIECILGSSKFELIGCWRIFCRSLGHLNSGDTYICFNYFVTMELPLQIFYETVVQCSCMYKSLKKVYLSVSIDKSQFQSLLRYKLFKGILWKDFELISLVWKLLLKGRLQIIFTKRGVDGPKMWTFCDQKRLISTNTCFVLKKDSSTWLKKKFKIGKILS